MKVKCLSIKNPLAYLVCAGIKDVENRTWTTNYRGRLYIHASGENVREFTNSDFPKIIIEEVKKIKIDGDGIAQLIKPSKYKSILRKILNLQISARENILMSHAIVGYVDLIDVTKEHNSIFAIPGQYHWILKNPKMLKQPILNIKGKLKIFEMEVEHVR
jgi:uncharacterized protein (DUF3820 family)